LEADSRRMDSQNLESYPLRKLQKSLAAGGTYVHGGSKFANPSSGEGVIAEANGGTKPERYSAHAPISVFGLRFELIAFIFIYIMGSIK
jgi:hypothetical protein